MAKKATTTIENHNGEMTRMPRVDRSSLDGIADGFADVFDGVMSGTIDPKQGNVLNNALRNKLSTHQAGFKILQASKASEDRIRGFAEKLLGLSPSISPALPSAKEKTKQHA